VSHRGVWCLRVGALATAIFILSPLVASPFGFLPFAPLIGATATGARTAHAADEPGALPAANGSGTAHPADTKNGAGEEPESGEPAPSLDLGKLALQLLNFAVLLFILIRYGGGAIRKMLAARHEQLKADLASAAALRAAAEAKLVKQEERLARLEGEITSMRQGILAEAASEKQRLMAAAQERTLRIQVETQFLVEQQVREAETRLRRESADAALKIAEEILRRSVGPSDQERLLDRFIRDIDVASPVKVTPGNNPPGKAGIESNGVGSSTLAEGIV
jgi:F-type H+-transporting ATPase subunit b